MDSHTLISRYEFFGAACMVSRFQGTSNEEMIRELEGLAKLNNITIPHTFDIMRQVDRKHFLVRREKLEEHFKNSTGYLLEQCNHETRAAINRIIDALPYKIQGRIAIDGKAEYFSNCIYFDMLLFHLVEPQKEENIAIIGETSGYLSALVAKASSEITLFERDPEVRGIAERNIEAAGIYNFTTVKVGTNLNQLASYEGQFEKVLSLGKITISEYERIKNLRKNKGKCIGIVKYPGEDLLVLTEDKDMLLAATEGETNRDCSIQKTN